MRKRIVLSVLLTFIILSTFVFGGVVAFAQSDTNREVNARSALLMDYDSGETVFEKESTKRLQIASMVKIMTLNIIFEEIENGKLSYDTMVTASENATSMGGSQAFLDANSEYKASELIKSIIVASANDSCVAMAEHISGNIPAFVNRMNEKASSLGMDNTYFVNCTGLPAPNQYSCASDVAKMTKSLIKHDGFFDFSKVWMFDFLHPSGRTTQLSNTNKLVRFYEGCDGGKTGFTSEALSCLSATAKRGDTRLICVVIGAPNSKTRNAEVSGLLNYGFENYETKRFCSEGEDVTETVKVENGTKKEIKCAIGDDLVAFTKKGENSEFSVEYQIDNLKAPIKVGDEVGEARLIKNGEIVKTARILACESVNQKGFTDIFDEIVDKW